MIWLKILAITAALAGPTLADTIPADTSPVETAPDTLFADTALAVPTYPYPVWSAYDGRMISYYSSFSSRDCFGSPHRADIFCNHEDDQFGSRDAAEAVWTGPSDPPPWPRSTVR